MFISIDQAVEDLHHGKIIVYPTEGVYGLGCDPNNNTALNNILKLKQRDSNKGLILIAASIEQLEYYIDFSDVSIDILDQIKQSWIGTGVSDFVTWIISINKNNFNKINKLLYCSSYDENNNINYTLAVRVTKHPVVIELCNKFGGPIVSTSANISGEEPISSISININNNKNKLEYKIKKIFDNKISGIVEGNLGGYTKSSRIIDSRTGKVVRS